MNYVLGGRTIGQVLGHSGGAAAVPWWLYGGVSAANAWAVYQPIGAASLAASYVNLANPGTYDAAPGTAPSFDTATGWTFSAASRQYLTTGYTPANDQTCSMIIRYTDAATTGGILAGVQMSMGTAFFGIQPLRTGSVVGYFSGSTALTISPSLANGVLAIAGNRAYRNGSQETGTMPVGSGTFKTPIYIGRMSGNESYPYYLSCKIQAIAIYNTTLSAAQVAAISSAMAAL